MEDVVMKTTDNILFPQAGSISFVKPELPDSICG